MKFIDFGGQKAAVIALDTLVIGTGCAGFNAADTLYDLGRTSNTEIPSSASRSAKSFVTMEIPALDMQYSPRLTEEV